MSRRKPFSLKKTNVFKRDDSVDMQDINGVLDEFICNTEILMRLSERKTSFYRDDLSSEAQEGGLLGDNKDVFKITGETFENTDDPVAEKAQKMERRLVDIFEREYSSDEEINARTYVSPANGWTETIDGRLVDNGVPLNGDKICDEFRLVMLGVAKSQSYVNANATGRLVNTFETNGLVRLAYIFKNCGPKL